MNDKRVVVVTGGDGQLGRTLKDVLGKDPRLEPLFIDKAELDICEKADVERYFESNKADIIINCAAYTAVDKAEEETESAHKINCEGVLNLALAAKRHGIRMVQISTDYVFSGDKGEPYKETDETKPATVYGKTKREGEEKLLEHLPDAIIIRTSWLYSRYGKNFMLTMRERALGGREARVVNDQTGAPTNAMDLAKVLLEIIVSKNWEPGIYHYSNGGCTSWFDFARKIYAKYGADPNLVTPVSTEEYGAKAKRPLNSCLDTTKIKETFKIEIPDWEDSLDAIDPIQ